MYAAKCTVLHAQRDSESNGAFHGSWQKLHRPFLGSCFQVAGHSSAALLRRRINQLHCSFSISGVGGSGMAGSAAASAASGGTCRGTGRWKVKQTWQKTFHLAVGEGSRPNSSSSRNGS